MEKQTHITARRHDIDALRVLVFGVLIFYHVGMFYVADWNWHIKSAYLSETLQTFMRMVNQWRMPLLFVISGIASSFLFNKLGAGRFASSRTRRLLIPLLFGMAVVVVPQAYYEALFRGAIEPGYGRFLWHYFTFQPWPDGAFAGSDIGVTWMHLWYLPYLLCYSLAFVPIAIWLKRRGQGAHARLLRLRGPWLIALPTVPLMIYAYTLFPIYGGSNHALLNDWYGHAMFFTFFAYGYLMSADTGIWEEIRRLRWWTLGLAICFYLLMRIPSGAIPTRFETLAEWLSTPVIMFNRWLWILTVLGWSYTLLNRPYRWLGYANEAVYPWYILHQTITVWIGFHIARYSLGPVVEPIIVVAVTIVGCLVLHEFLIRRNRWLRPLFGLKPLASPRVTNGIRAGGLREGAS
jgi:glucans biosynthesis protein C